MDNAVSVCVLSESGMIFVSGSPEASFVRPL